MAFAIRRMNSARRCTYRCVTCAVSAAMMRALGKGAASVKKMRAVPEYSCFFVQRALPLQRLSEASRRIFPTIRAGMKVEVTYLKNFVALLLPLKLEGPWLQLDQRRCGAATALAAHTKRRTAFGPLTKAESALP